MPDDLAVAAQSGLPIAAPPATDPMVRAPKFKNTENPAETWVGRGRRPRWLKDQLAAGRSLDEFRGLTQLKKRQRFVGAGASSTELRTGTEGRSASLTSVEAVLATCGQCEALHGRVRRRAAVGRPRCAAGGPWTRNHRKPGPVQCTRREWRYTR